MIICPYVFHNVLTELSLEDYLDLLVDWIVCVFVSYKLINIIN